MAKANRISFTININEEHLVRLEAAVGKLEKRLEKHYGPGVEWLGDECDPLSAPHTQPDDCPTWNYPDGCECTVERLKEIYRFREQEIAIKRDWGRRCKRAEKKLERIREIADRMVVMEVSSGGRLIHMTNNDAAISEIKAILNE